MQSLFTKYIKANPPTQPEAYELKIEKGKSIAFNRFADHQIVALIQVEELGHYHKIQDMAAKSGYADPKPFDAFYLKGKSFVVIWFYKPRQKKIFYKVPLNKWLELKWQTERKSATEAMVASVAEVIEIS